MRSAGIVHGLAAALSLVGCGPAGEGSRPVIGFAVVSSAAPLEEARDGFFRALADSGFIPDSVKIIERNAQGDIATLMLIMNEFKQRDVDYVATLASVTTQAAIRVISSQPIVFGAVANPYIIGAGTSATEHRPNITGANIPLPVDSAFVLAHEVWPDVKTWGTLYDPADPFAEYYLEMGRETAKHLGVGFITVACTSPGDIAPGIQALKAKGAGGIMQIPSVMIGGGYAAVVKTASQLRVPLVSSNTGYSGVPLSLGLSFYANGYDAGNLLIRVMRGENPGNIPFQAASKRVLIVDLDAAREFGLTIPDALVARADSVIGGR